MSKKPKTTEIVYRWPDGKQVVKYRRGFGSLDAKILMKHVDDLGKSSNYFYRHI